MHYLEFEAYPKPNHERYGVIDGAYICCWVNDPDPAEAESRARERLEQAGWDIEKLEESYPATKDAFAGNQYFEQARTDGIVLLINTWPVGAPEEE